MAKKKKYKKRHALFKLCLETLLRKTVFRKITVQKNKDHAQTFLKSHFTYKTAQMEQIFHHDELYKIQLTHYRNKHNSRL